MATALLNAKSTGKMGGKKVRKGHFHLTAGISMAILK